ncbi:MAG: tetratricopeptide repeat protein [Gammaproteobacteria bacterium]|nr:tetratricopeptide repeat protein [Gammaproteobacteria bacterium]MDE0479740.1 tetratricopeptide repeat protein [Gammaproteobacteria bacterium]MDE0509395.1 tetratricopeptide repeat protein [Gammaproteobacteria bacterium]
MAISAAEEENIEALRRWWDENGKFLLLIVIVAAAGYGGWSFWQQSSASGRATASDLYEEILIAAQPLDVTQEPDAAVIVELADQLMENHPGSIYARYGALFSAQQSVQQGDLAAAEEVLQWVVDNAQTSIIQRADEGLVLTATLRLGRVMLARGDPDRALLLVNSVDPRSFEPGFHELRGDIYLVLGRPEDARDSWLAAQDAGSVSDGLRMKLENLGGLN